MRYINELFDGDRVICHYLCKKKETLKTKLGKNYMSLILQDKTGTINAKVWTLNHDIHSFESGDFIKIEGDVTTYQDEPELRVTRIRKSMEGEYDPTEYFPATEADVGSIISRLNDFMESITDTHVKTLVKNIYAIDEIRLALPTHSAAKNMHHSYLGGLCEHTLNVVQICEFLAPRYKFVNRDLLIASALLHDIGKIFELSPFPENDYTDDGQLVGHIVHTAQLIHSEAAKIQGFPPRLERLLVHSIISHHGKLEWGSPKLPKTIEAAILHIADNADANLKMFEDAISKGGSQGDWVGYHRSLTRDKSKSSY